MRANFVGKSPVSAITHTPASGPFELVTTPLIGCAPALPGASTRSGAIARSRPMAWTACRLSLGPRAPARQPPPQEMNVAARPFSRGLDDENIVASPRGSTLGQRVYSIDPLALAST